MKSPGTVVCVTQRPLRLHAYRTLYARLPRDIAAIGRLS